MKPNRDAAALAASLTSAAAASLPLPARVSAPIKTSVTPIPQKLKAPKSIASSPAKITKVLADTVQMTLRPNRELVSRYTIAAAERTKKEGRVVSAQEIMIEILQTGPKVQK
jgi:hypothetical protein